jgi:S-adenosylmethionine hydrolase
VDGDALVAHAAGADGFGNVALDATHEDLAGTALRLGRPLTVRIGERRAAGVYARTFADVRAGGLLLYEDAGGALALAVNGGDAAALLGARTGDEVRVEPA